MPFCRACAHAHTLPWLLTGKLPALLHRFRPRASGLQENLSPLNIIIILHGTEVTCNAQRRLAEVTPAAEQKGWTTEP